MPIPCEKAETIERVELKIDRLFEAVTNIAVQNQRISALEDQVIDHETRIRNIESAPMKRLEKAAWMIIGGLGSIGAAVLIAIVVWEIGVVR